ncbi:hypothetical protein KKF91_13995, partial [Myxococcota bacterium]|nr:hypothetical protein [Myxococcota bacterium]
MNGQRLGLIFIASAALLLLYAGLRGLDLTGWLAARQGAAPQRAHRAVETANELRDPKGFALTLPTGWRVERRGRDHIRVECERAAFAGRGEGEPEGFVRTGGEAPRVDLLRADGGGAQIRWRP